MYREYFAIKFITHAQRDGVIPVQNNLLLTSFRKRPLHRTQHIRPRVQIHKHYAQIVVAFLDCLDQTLILEHFVEILKQSAPEESGESEKPESEPKDRTITI